MCENCYLYHLPPTSHVLTLIKDETGWKLRIDEKMIGQYDDPLQAAFDVSTADFVDEQLVRLFKKFRVPSDLNMWQPCYTNRKVHITRD